MANSGAYNRSGEVRSLGPNNRFPSRPSHAASPIARNDIKPSAGVWLFIVGLTALFIMMLQWGGIVGREAEMATGVQRYITLAWCLTLGGAFWVSLDHKCTPWENTQTRKWIVMYGAIFSLMVARFVMTDVEILTASSTQQMLATFSQPVLIYLAPLLLIPCGAVLLRSRLVRCTIAIHATAGSLLGLWQIIRYGLVNRADYFGTYTDISFAGSMPYYAVPLSILLIPHLPRWLVAGVLAGIAATFAFIVTFQSRISSVTIPLIIVFLLIGRLREGGGGGLYRKLLRPALSLLLIGGGVGICIFAMSGTISSSMDALVDRWSGDVGAVKTVMEDARYEETVIVAGQLTPLDWLIGRGVGGTWRDARLYNGELRTMVHLGYLQFAFAGGIVLWHLFCFAPVYAAFRAWRPTSGLEYVAVAFVFTRAIEMFGYGVPLMQPDWILVCICVGAVLNVVLSPAPNLKRPAHKNFQQPAFTPGAR